MSNSDDDYSYIYLDFNEKLTSNIFANKMFLRIANLHKPNPLVQINDLVFKGSYDECVGTNLFFDEIEDPPLKSNIFAKDTPIRLKPLISQTKVLKLKQIKLPRKAPTAKHRQACVVLNLNQEYNQALEKLEQGILNIDDIAHREPEPPLTDPFTDLPLEPHVQPPTEPETELASLLDSLSAAPTSALEAKYERLKRLARRPAKRMKSPELLQDCAPEFRNAFEYHNLERQVCQSSDAFRSVWGPIVAGGWVGGVDVTRCVLQGLIPADVDRAKDEQRKIFTIDNFENLSIPARYLVLKKCVGQIEELIEGSSSEELKETDENGRTIADICDVFRRLVGALELVMGQAGEWEGGKGTDLSERGDEDYVKYKYEPSNELFETSQFFNYDEWTDEEEKGMEGDKGHDLGLSDDSIEDESDQN
ncbi:uncharacterized protein LOC103314470 [Tribolium castaneum]|uniref:Transcription factor TFIIIC triple barrel domain-containing protein n=1 Tax=Tribolium castaneum TaxID=7070 RepID=D6X4M5_TRICA|nr:PREDICTED: uncharacterized protein LOC103314470 isoform X2 [Tribolium castaneum]XP_015839589.1 PREDICTED: uncharacterized protein LOC103314470 isoform X1 [Tribolium castaneum]EEZ97248.2 hypothetical protein TcasGA2_TC011047 [Tribolium castaneum]|eukprot:XP_008198836.1 PREDICTED: uncharacterized protein LOC103314470 isoform X2 [Tribolium castaneum]